MKWGHSWFHLTLCTECLQRCPAVFTRAASLPPLSAGGHRDWPGSMSTNQSVSEKEEERSHFTSCSLPSKPVLGACYAKRARLYSPIQVPFCNKGSFASLDTSSVAPTPAQQFQISSFMNQKGLSHQALQSAQELVDKGQIDIKDQ